MSAILREQWWENGRLHRVWMEPLASGNVRVWHERLIPPKAIEQHRLALEDLKFSAKDRAREADGLHKVAVLTTNERDELFKLGIRGGDVDGIKWALKQDKYRHAKVGS